MEPHIFAMYQKPGALPYTFNPHNCPRCVITLSLQMRKLTLKELRN